MPGCAADPAAAGSDRGHHQHDENLSHLIISYCVQISLSLTLSRSYRTLYGFDEGVEVAIVVVLLEDAVEEIGEGPFLQGSPDADRKMHAAI